MTAIASTELIAELEHVVRAGSAERRTRILRQVTSLFLADADRLSDDHIGVFDDVLVRLIESVEPPALTKLSAPLADLKSVPKELVRRLAHHEDAAVAGPILCKCECLSDSDLVDIAGERGEKHLSAIAGRKRISRSLTDVLLRRGDTSVLRMLAKNPGAQFSAPGFATLNDAAARDDEIAYSLVVRPDLPPSALRELIAKCTPAVQARLLKIAPPDLHKTIQATIDDIAAHSHARKPQPVDYTEAKAMVLALNNAGQLSDSAVNRFAVRGEHRNIVAALSLLATVPTETIEPLLEADDCQGLAIACRASRLNWNTTAAVIKHRKGGKPASQEALERAKEVFESHSLSTAQRAIRFGSVHDWAAKSSSAATELR
jgi:uncharacterized protein (DUF2336 family)